MSGAPGSAAGVAGAVLSDRELYLARSALGLRDGDRSQSYRNRFYLFDQSDDHDAWLSMVERGLATGTRRFWPEMSSFHLTRTGAEAALKPGESLCREDFPLRADRPRAGSVHPGGGEP